MAALFQSLRYFFFFIAILLLLSIDPTTPVPSRVASQWRERLPPTTATTTTVSRQGPLLLVAGHVPYIRATPSNYVLTTLLFGGHSSSRILVPPVGRQARTTRTTPSNYVRTTLLFGAHSSPRLLVASVPRPLCHVDHSAAELPKP